MAVSLEKKRIKVDLSKPELPTEVREYTPVHLMDEDETIKKPTTEIASNHSSEPVRQTDAEALPDHMCSEPGKGLTSIFYVFRPLVLCVGLGFLIFALPDILAFIYPSDGTEREIVSIIRSMSTNPFIIIFLVLNGTFLSVRNILKKLEDD